MEGDRTFPQQQQQLSAPPSPALQKPPGYKDPTGSPAPATPSRPPPRPAKKPPLPPAFRKKSKRSCCRCCCCCLLFIFLFILVAAIVLAGVSGAVYLWYRPSLPVFHLQSLKARDFDVVVGPDGATVSADVAAKVQATNSNEKVELHYGTTRCKVVEPGGVGLGEATAPGFLQGSGNVTVMGFTTTVRRLEVDDEVGQRLKKGVATKALALGVELRTTVGIQAGKVRTGRVQVLVACGPVPLRRLDAGDTPKCNIRVFNWFTLP
ncbi:NDR1/HIN1-like protein 13 [Nymphaea colorata]|uniref:NDR1/HIN1-like protein 13 n=1 Tax=Nymphaea colorata TaxID=210225 RepID=UPI00129D4F13|nr:NDR1/HIN1-like protein 13 [Nymphaea colorata]